MGSTAPYSRMMPEVKRQQTLMFPSDNTCSTNDGSPIRFCPISDLWNNGLQLATRWTPIELDFYLDNYANAFVDINSTLTTKSATCWTQGTPNGLRFEIYDPHLVIRKYKLQTPVIPRFTKMLGSSGIEIPFSMVRQRKNINFSKTQNTLDITLDEKNVQNLERVILCFRRQIDTNNTSNTDRYALRNGSDAEIPTGGTYIASGSIANTATLMSCATNYNGVHKITVKWLSENLINGDAIYCRPYHFHKLKELASTQFVDKKLTNLQSYTYEGIDYNTNLWLNSNTQWFIGLDFRTCIGSEMSGISLAKGPIDIILEMKTSGNVPARTNDLSVDAFMFCGSVAKCFLGGITVVN